MTAYADELKSQCCQLADDARQCILHSLYIACLHVFGDVARSLVTSSSCGHSQV